MSNDVSSSRSPLNSRPQIDLSKGKVPTLSPTEELRERILGVIRPLDQVKRARAVIRRAKSPRVLIHSLAALTPHYRLVAATALIEASLENPGKFKLIEAQLGALFSLLSTGQRAALLTTILSAKNSRHRVHLAIDLLRCSKGSSQLRSIIKLFGSKKLLTEGVRLKEFCAIAAITGALKNIEYPPRFTTRLAPRQVRERCKEIASAFRRARYLLATEPSLARFSDTLFFKQVQSILLRNVRLADTLVARLPKSQLPDAANGLIAKAQIELQTGVAFKVSDVPYWTVAELRQVASAVKAVPRLISFPLVRTVILSAPNSDGDIGEYGDSVITLFRDPQALKEVSHWIPKGVSPFEWTMVHELGHALLTGMSPKTRIGRTVSTIPNLIDPIVDFATFEGISEWKILPKSSYRITDGGQTVTIGTERLVLNEPVRYEGKSWVFIYDKPNSRLFRRAAETQWGASWYARTNSEEDFTESLAYYVTSPSSLIPTAPKKFEFLETEFRLHQNDRVLLRSLRRSLQPAPKGMVPAKTRPAPLPNFLEGNPEIWRHPRATSFACTLFSRLRLKERAWVLAQLHAVKDDSLTETAVYQRYHDFKNRDSQWLNQRFFHLMGSRADLKDLGHWCLTDVLKGYDPALLALMGKVLGGYLPALITQACSPREALTLAMSFEQFIGVPFFRHIHLQLGDSDRPTFIGRRIAIFDNHPSTPLPFSVMGLIDECVSIRRFDARELSHEKLYWSLIKAAVRFGHAPPEEDLAKEELNFNKTRRLLAVYSIKLESHMIGKQHPNSSYDGESENRSLSTERLLEAPLLSTAKVRRQISRLELLNRIRRPIAH